MVLNGFYRYAFPISTPVPHSCALLKITQRLTDHVEQGGDIHDLVGKDLVPHKK